MKLGVAHRVPYPLTEVALDRPYILAGIGQLVAGGVADHVRMNLKGQVGLLAGSLHHPVEAVPGEWRATTFGRERERRLGLLLIRCHDAISIRKLVRASASTSEGSFASVHGIGGAEGTGSRVDDDATAEVMAASYLALLGHASGLPTQFRIGLVQVRGNQVTS